jgi:pilus assembly protein CpaB
MAEKRYTLVFVAAVVVALAATYGVFRMLRAMRMNTRIATTSVVVATHDVTEGRALESRDIDTRQWPAFSIPAGAYSAPDSIIGRVTRVAIFEGEPIVPGRLAPMGTAAGLEVKITPGKRAMAVRIDDVAGISGLIQPNSRVDVLVSMRDAGAGDRRLAKLFMENMRVLSVGTQVQRGQDGKPIRATTATLEVNPDEAERLAIAVGQGSIQLVLRGYGDPDSIRTRGATSNEVLAQLRAGPTADPAPVVAPVREKRHASPPPVHTEPPQRFAAVLPLPAAPKRADSVTVQVYRAGKPTQQRFQRSDSTGAGPADSTPQQ